MEHGPIQAGGDHSSAAVLEIRAEPQSWPLCVELAIDPQIFLYEAKLVQDCGLHRRALPISYQSECSAIWRHIEPCRSQRGEVALEVRWISIAPASPGSQYRATLSVRDARLELLHDGMPIFNPAWRTCQIGPAHEPTDHGRFDIVIRDTPRDVRTAAAGGAVRPGTSA